MKFRKVTKKTLLKIKTWLQVIALPGGVGSPDVTKEAQVLVISFDIDASVSGRLEHFIFTKVLLFWNNNKKGLDKTNWHGR